MASSPELQAFVRGGQVRDEASLRRFLALLLKESIAPVDFPVIRWAREAAARNDANGLIELDRFVASLPIPQALRSASIKVGQQHLRGFGSLKGHSFLPRYRAAIEAGQAHGHHPVVYGISLVLFSIPLREGLLAHGYQTIQGFASSASAQLRLPPSRIQSVIEEVSADLPRHVEASLRVRREQGVPTRAAQAPAAQSEGV